MPSSEHPTLIPCAACGGEYQKTSKDARVNPEECKWCTQGHMSDTQLQAWRRWRTGDKE